MSQGNDEEITPSALFCVECKHLIPRDCPAYNCFECWDMSDDNRALRVVCDVCHDVHYAWHALANGGTAHALYRLDRTDDYDL